MTHVRVHACMHMHTNTHTCACISNTFTACAILLIPKYYFSNRQCFLAKQRIYVVTTLFAIYKRNMLVSRGQTLLRRALSIRDKRPREKAPTGPSPISNSFSHPSPSQGVNKYLPLYEAFLLKRSCETQLLLTVNDFTENLNKKDQTDVI